MKIGIFKTFAGELTIKNAINACEELGVNYEVVDIYAPNWIQLIQSSDCDGFFCPSSSFSQERKTIQDERYYFVSQIMKRPIYPDFLGLYIHESKRNMAAWLELNNYCHAKTAVFCRRKEAIDYLEDCQYPVVIKANVGAGASKVRIVENKRKAKSIARQALPDKWLTIHKGYIYWHKGVPDLHNIQKDYFIVQEYIPNILHEWRILKIGNSYFGHQKLLKGQYASGSGLVGWVAPPKELLLLVKDICERGGFLCMDVDIFETQQGGFFINELQASFGSFLPYQMSIDGVHGRYRYENGDFVFEEGDFNVYGSIKLKIEHFIQLLSGKNQ